MSGIKRKIEDKDPDYEDISVVHQNKRHKVVEQNARDATIQKIEAIIKDQFSIEMKNKEHEIEVIVQRLNEARRMMDKLRACIVANYYSNAGQPKVSEGAKCDPSVFNHPAIKRFLESPSRSSSPLNQGSETPSLVHSETESLTHLSECQLDKEGEHLYKEEPGRQERRPGRNIGKDTFGVSSVQDIDQRVTYHTTGEDSSRLYVKKTIVVGNVSKYIPPDKREENDQSTHKWMVYVRGSRREPSIDHFVKKVWFFLHPSYKPNDLVEVRPKPTEKITLGSHGNSAFQPITASCKIVSQGQTPNPAESPGKSFQPITMSCKIVSGSPISTPSHSPLPRTSTSTPVHMKHSSSVINNPYIIVDKPGQMIGTATSIAIKYPTGKQTSISQAFQGAKSPAPKIHGSSFISSAVKEESLFAAMPPLCPIGSQAKVQSPKPVSGGLGAFTKVIVKQEPGEAPQQQQQQQQMMVSTATLQQTAQQFVTVKGGHMIALSPQKQASTVGTGSTQSKVVGIPMGSTLQSAIKQTVPISGGQILVAKPNSAANKVMGQKQVIAQGVAKAIVSAASATMMAQSVHTVTKAQISSSGAPKTGSQGSVMATLQLPANNLANLANLPPGTKLYLTTNSKNPSGKGKLLLIPQGAILRASNPSGQQSASSAGGGSQTTSSSLPPNLSYTSYILKQTPQGTFLVGQPAPQGSGKQVAAGSASHSLPSSSGQQQTIRVTAGQKAAILAQVAGQTSTVKLSDGSVKTVAAAPHLSKPGTTTLRMTGGVITAASSMGAASAASSAAGAAPQKSDGGSLSSVAASAQGVKPAVQQPILVPQSQAGVIGAAKSVVPSAVSVSKSVSTSVVTVTKSIIPSLVSVAKSSSPSIVTAASLVSSSSTASGKTAATLSGMLKIHSGQSNAQQAVLTIPASQLKQLGVSSAAGGVQTVLMPVSKVKSEPGVVGPSSSAVPSANGSAAVKVEQGTEASLELINTENLKNLHQLLTALVKKFPLIISEKTEDSSPFCARSVEQYYSWNIGKRRAAEWQRAVAVKKVLQEILDKSKRFQNITPLKSKQIVQWCRQRGYTPPDLEPMRSEEDSMEDILTQIDNEPGKIKWQRAVAVKKVLQEILDKSKRFQNITPLKSKQIVQWCRQRGYTPPDLEPMRSEEDSMEDILTQIDNEPECPVTYLPADELCQRLQELQGLLKTEPESEEEVVDVVGVKQPVKIQIKQEKEDEDEEVRFYLGPSPATEFVRDAAQQIGISFQPVELEKKVYGPAVEDMILKATEQFATEILREALAVAFARSPQNRIPREITAMNIHQAVSSIPTCDFLTNKYMGILMKDNHPE
ncbi:UNVERIFIED_CONTAM: hypothetical protein FKN15_014806 [Acipenser sinensis]